jgi:hypothetical protein
MLRSAMWGNRKRRFLQQNIWMQLVQMGRSQRTRGSFLFLWQRLLRWCIG